jgi:hypothetical protein
MFNEKYGISFSPMNKLQSISIDFDEIFRTFKLEDILTIYNNLILETRLIFFSSNLSILSLIIQSFLSLIFPLKYPFYIVFFLPNESYSLLENPLPYIVGIAEKYHSSFFFQNNIDLTDTSVLIIDIEGKTVKMRSFYSDKCCSLLSINNKKKKDFSNIIDIDLPRRYKIKLENSLKKILEEIPSTKKKKEKLISNIRQLFLKFMVSILRNYKDYVNLNYYTSKESLPKTIDNLFKINEFLYTVSTIDIPFYKKFLKTNIFSNFIIQALFPKDNNEKLDTLFFDESIIEKKNRKLFSKKVYLI